MVSLAQKLANDPVFSHLTERDRADLADLAFHKTYEKGQFICLQEDLWKRALYLSSGMLGWVMIAADGKRQVVFRIKPNTVVWGHSLFDNKPMPASLEVIEKSEVCMWEGDAILPITSRSANAAWAVTAGLVSSMRQVRDVVYGFAFHPVAGRLANLLLRHYQPIEGKSTPRTLSLEEMAQAIGTSRELVSKTLHQFADQEMIEVSRVEFVFTDRKKLEEVANE